MAHFGLKTRLPCGMVTGSVVLALSLFQARANAQQPSSPVDTAPSVTMPEEAPSTTTHADIPESAWDATVGRKVEIELEDGTLATGTLLAHDAESFSITNMKGKIVVKPKADVIEVRLTSEPADPSPATPSVEIVGARLVLETEEAGEETRERECVRDAQCAQSTYCVRGSCEVMEKAYAERIQKRGERLILHGKRTMIAGPSVVLVGALLFTLGPRKILREREDSYNMCVEEAIPGSSCSNGGAVPEIQIPASILIGLGTVASVTGVAIYIAGKMSVKRAKRYGPVGQPIGWIGYSGAGGGLRFRF